MVEAEVAKYKASLQKPPKGCEIVRTTTSLGGLPTHVQVDAGLLALQREQDTFELFGVIFKAVSGDPHVQGHAPSSSPHWSAKKHGPKLAEQCNWVAWSTKRGILSRRSLCKGSGKRVCFGEPPAEEKRKGSGKRKR